MIAGIFHQGSGLGDQLFRYVTVRTLAEEKGYEWGMLNKHHFKGTSFMNLDMGKETHDAEFAHHFEEKKILENRIDIRSYDPEINFVQDNTTIDGCFEDSKYWMHNLDSIKEWLQIEPLQVSNDLCVIGFRGGEYALNPDLFLGREYYESAGDKLREISTPLKFEVHTDDVKLAKEFFAPELFFHQEMKVIDNEPLSHSEHTNMGLNWRSARYAKHAIIPNSAFFVLPRLLKHLEDSDAITIAPRYWARRNIKTWARPASYHKQFHYV